MGGAAAAVLAGTLLQPHGDRRRAAPPPSPPTVDAATPIFTGADARSGRGLVVAVADTYAAVVDPRSGRERRIVGAVPAAAYAESALTIPGHLLLTVAGDGGLSIRLVDLSSGEVIERIDAQDVAEGLPGRSPWVERAGRWHPLLGHGRGIALGPGERLLRETDDGLLTLAPAVSAGATSTRLILRDARTGRWVRDLTGPGQLLTTTRSGAVWLPRGRNRPVVFVDDRGRATSLQLRAPLLSLAAAASPDGRMVLLITGTGDGLPTLTVKHLDTGETCTAVLSGYQPPYRVAWAPDASAVFVTADRALWVWRPGYEPRRLGHLAHTPLALLPF